LRGLQLNLLIEVDLLLSNNVQLSDLVIDDSLSFFEGTIDFANLILDFLDLNFCLLNHLFCIGDLVVEMLLMLTSFIVLEVTKHQGLPLLQELGLAFRDLVHLKNELLNLLQVCLILLT